MDKPPHASDPLPSTLPRGHREGSTTPLSGAQWTIAAEGHEAVVVEVGGGLRHYRWRGVDYVDGYGDDELPPGCAGQILAPWPNRIRDGRYTFGDRQLQLSLTEPIRNNAIHGLVNWQPWTLAERAPDAVTIECAMPAQPGYPWPLRLRAEWRVGADGLRVTHSATNAAHEPCPFGFSVHPYLRLPGARADDMLLHVPARSRVLVDGRLLPVGAQKVAGTEFDFTAPRRIGTTVLDTAFGDVDRREDGSSAVTLSTSDGEHAVTIWGDAEFGWWQVFSSDTLTGDRFRRAVAIEPMTCVPDAFRSGRGLITLQPGETWFGTWGITPSLAA